MGFFLILPVSTEAATGGDSIHGSLEDESGDVVPFSVTFP